MNVTAQAQMTPESSTVTDLLARRSQVEQWLARLDQADPEVPERVIARVREDYEGRLRAIVEQLTDHRSTVEAEVARLTTDAADAAAAHEAAVDALEEARLRQRIGEISDEEWEERRPELEGAVTSTTERRAEVEAEAERMRSILAQIGGGDAAAAEPLELETADQAEQLDHAIPLIAEPLIPIDDGTFDDDFHIEAAEGILDLPPLESLEVQEAQDFAIPGLDFLEEVDRAIAEPGEQAFSAPVEAAPGTEEVAEAETSPKKGVKCAECGYTNDPAAWYCGVCGVDLS